MFKFNIGDKVKFKNLRGEYWVAKVLEREQGKSSFHGPVYILSCPNYGGFKCRKWEDRLELYCDYKFNIGDKVLWKYHPDFRPQRIYSRYIDAKGINVYVLKREDGYVTSFSEQNLVKVPERVAFSCRSSSNDFKFDLGDIVEYNNPFSTCDPGGLFQVVKRHKGNVNNLYTIVSRKIGFDSKPLYGPRKYVKIEKWLSLHSKSRAGKWLKELADVCIEAGGVVDSDYISQLNIFDIADMMSTNYISPVYMRALDKQTKESILSSKRERMNRYTDFLLDQETLPEEKNIVHFGE